PTSGSSFIFGFASARDAVDVKRKVGYLPGDVPGAWKLPAVAQRDRRHDGGRPRQHRTDPGGDIPQLFQREEAQSPHVMIAIAFGLRLGRWGIVGFSLAAFVSTLVQTVGFYQIAGQGPGERIAFGNSILALASQCSALFPPPFRPDTVVGYVECAGFHPLAILFAIWALASATGAARGDEERGLVEASLAAGI